MTSRFEMRPSRDPWHGRQPQYEKIVRRAPNQYELPTKLPSGEPIAVRLGRVWMQFEPRP